MKITRSILQQMTTLLDKGYTITLNPYGTLVIKTDHWGYSIGLTDHFASAHVEDQLRDAEEFLVTMHEKSDDTPSHFNPLD